jgi:uncharacterized SAM-binding protein YcdF (DUF218 family)
MKRLRSIVAVVLVMLLLWGAAWLAARALIVRRELDRADAIVVLAGSATYKERIDLAAKLVKEGRAPNVVLTDDHERASWSNAEERNPPYVELAAQRLRFLGVGADRIDVISAASSGTHYEALRLREYADSKKLRSLLVVTSAYHSRRALRELETVFQDSGVALGIEPVPPGEQTPTPATWWLHPRGWMLVPGEYIKMGYYWLRFK